MLNVANFLTTSLRQSIGAVDTVLPLETGGGSLFDYMATGDFVYLTISDRTSKEIVKYTKGAAIVSDNMTPVARGQDNTIGRAFPAGSCVQAQWTIAQLTQFAEYISSVVFSTTPPFNNTVTVITPPVTPPATGVLFAVDTVHSKLYFWNGASWVDLSGLTDIFGIPVSVPDGFNAVFDRYGRLSSYTDSFQYITRTMNPAAGPMVVPSPIGTATILPMPTVTGVYGGVLTPTGTAGILVTPPSGKSAYVRFVSNFAVGPIAAMTAERYAFLSVKTGPTGYVTPNPASATATPSQSASFITGSTKPSHMSVCSDVIQVAAATAFNAFIECESNELQTQTAGSYGPGSFSCHLLAIR